jgi:hypothetical protein
MKESVMDTSTGVPSEPLPKFEELGIETNFLKLGDRVFAVKQIGEGFNIDVEMREFYKAKVDTLTELTNNAVLRDVHAEHQAQIERIQEARSRGQVSIPRDKLGKCVAYTMPASEVMECVPIVYHPWQVIGTKAQLMEMFQAAKGRSWRAIAAEDETVVTIDNNLYIPAFVGIGRKTSKLWMLGGLKTPHTMVDGNLCISQSPFVHYARLNSMEMSKQISIINLFSAARQSIVFGDAAVEISLETLCRQMSSVVSVEKNVRTQWQR